MFTTACHFKDGVFLYFEEKKTQLKKYIAAKAMQLQNVGVFKYFTEWTIMSRIMKGYTPAVNR